MIDPSDVTKFDRTVPELQEFLLFCVIVAGKKASTQAVRLEYFLDSLEGGRDGRTPFQIIEEMIELGVLLEKIKESGMGQYNRLYHVFQEVLSLDLRKCSFDDLEAIKGIGPKTSRYFLLHSRENEKLAVLDRHILRWLSEKYAIKAPANTPSTPKAYRKFETLFLEYCEKHKLSPADLDLAIWNFNANKKLTPGIPV